MKETIVNDSDGITNNLERSMRITRLASLLGILLFTIISVGFWLGYLISGRIPARLIGGIVFSLAFLSYFVAYLAQRRSKFDLANWIMLATLIAIGIVPSFVFSGTGLLASLAALSLAMVLAAAVLQNRQLLIFFGAGLGSLLVSQIADAIGSSSRPMMMQPALATSLSIVMAAVMIFVLALRFQTYPFRVKIIISLWGITASAILIIAAVSFYLSSQFVMQKNFSSLSSAARLVGGAVDQFVSRTQSILAVESQLPDIGLYINDPDPAGSLHERVDQILQNLSKKTAISSSDTSYQNYLQAYMLLDRQGNLIYDSSDPLAVQDLSKTDFYRHSIQNPNPYVSPVYFTVLNRTVIYFSAQVQDQSGKPAGVLVARYDASVLQQILLQYNDLVADQSYAILVDENGLRLAQGAMAVDLYRPLIPMDVELVAGLSQQNRLPPGQESTIASDLPDLGRQLQLKAGTLNLTFRAGETSDGPYYYAATDFIHSQPWTVIYINPQAVILDSVMKQVRSIQLLGGIILIVALVVAYGLSRILVEPVLNMTETTAAITGGNFAARAEVRSEDEFGALSRSVNELADRMRISLQNMEHQIEDRTRDLEQRSSQLQATAEIGRAVSTIHNVNELLERSVTLISERFNFYHVGIFMIDESGRFAVLRAANSEGGKRMLSRSHRLAVGQQGIVGYVTSTGRSRIALDVGSDAVFFNNPDLPATRSEMALPLISGERILGALDVQSDEPGAFTNEDVTVIQVLADFLAVALENARLFFESQTALDSIRHAYGELSQRSWIDRLENVTNVGFRSLDQGVFSIEDAPQVSERENGQKLSIPIRVRETLIGYVDAYKPSTRGEWTKEELDTVDAMVDQLGVALESARLFEDSQLLAERERLVKDFNTRLQESLDIDAVVRTAVSEMRKILGSQQVTLVLGEGKEE